MSMPSHRARGEAGFSLIEVVAALSILLVGLLGLAQVFYFGLSIASTSSTQLIAREKAREAIESIHTARDTRIITWDQIRNAGAPNCAAFPGTTGNGGGQFMTGIQSLEAAGDDGLVATADDDGYEMAPGEDLTLGTADDEPLEGFRRDVTICDVDGNANLRLISVTIEFDGSAAVGQRTRTYTLTSYISSFS
jgi:prepilin-type N-terminal cleavage/methylation domain-containing protein